MYIPATARGSKNPKTILYGFILCCNEIRVTTKIPNNAIPVER